VRGGGRTWLPSRKSFKRPGVAMTTCTPLCRSRSWELFGAPPYTQVLRMPDDRPNLSASVLICMASSRVGASTSRVGPWRASLRVAWMWSMPGSRKPHVLPLPVLAMATMSRPLRAIGHAWAWMGVGALKPACLICERATQKRLQAEGERKTGSRGARSWVAEPR
jgi:hypothetical protein